MRGGGFSCFPCSPLRVPYLWVFLGSSLVFNKLHLLIKKKKPNCRSMVSPCKSILTLYKDKLKKNVEP